MAKLMTTKFAVVCAMASCASQQPLRFASSTRSSERLLVVAPHPDDEILMAAGRIGRAVGLGGAVRVVVMTNGDYQCQWNGYVRERETLTALHDLGVEPHQVFFLGYPDGFLDSLTDAPLTAEIQTRDRRCESRRSAYNDAGERSQSYTRSNAVNDLREQLTVFRPTDIVVTHALDTHPDHATTNILLREAITMANVTTTLHQVIVHAGPCYPANIVDGRCVLPFLGSFSDQMTPPLAQSGSFNSLPDPTRLPYQVSADWPPPKARLIGYFQTQLTSDRDWLYSFARSDEVFFDETIEHH